MLEHYPLGHELVDVVLGFDHESAKITFPTSVIPEPLHVGGWLEFQFNVGDSGVGFLVDDEEIFGDIKVKLLSSKNPGFGQTSLESALGIIELLHK